MQRTGWLALIAVVAACSGAPHPASEPHADPADPAVPPPAIPATQDDPSTPCGRDPIADGDVHALVAATTVGDAAARRAALHRLAGRLAVDRIAPVRSKLDVDVIVDWIEAPIPITPELVAALATGLLDDDAGVRRCAAEAITADLFSFPQPVRPAPRFTLTPDLGQRLVATIQPHGGPPEETATISVLLAAGQDGRNECDGGYWRAILPATPAPTLVRIAEATIARAEDQRWRSLVCATLAGVVHVAGAAGELDPILAAAAIETDPYLSLSTEDTPLDALAELVKTALPVDQETRVLAYLERHAGEAKGVALLGAMRQPANVKRAASRLAGLMTASNTAVYDAAALALVHLPGADSIALAARTFAAVLAGKETVAMQAVAAAIPSLDPSGQRAVLPRLLAAARTAAYSEYTRRPLILAVGSSARDRKTVAALIALLSDPAGHVRAAAAEAIALIPDAALQERAVAAVTRAVDDPDGLTRADAAKTLGQFHSVAARKQARAALVAIQGRLLPSDQRSLIASCALEQIDGTRAVDERCGY